MANQVQIGKAFVVIGGKAGPLYKTLSQVSKRMRAFGQSLNAIGAQMVKTAGLMALPFGLAARTFMQFSDQMLQVKAVTQSTQDEFSALNDTAKELGRTTSFTAAEVAGGMTELGRAGFKANQIISAIPGTLDLARGTATDLSRTAEILANTLNQFGMSAAQSTQVVDLLSATANNSATTLDDLGEAFKMVGPLAKSTGISIDDVATSLGVLANAGLKGTTAGTGLARILKNLTQGTTADFWEELGLTQIDVVDKATGGFRKISDILSDIISQTQGMSEVARAGIFENLFGRGMVASLSLTSDKFGEMAGRLKNIEGVAARTAREMDSGLGGAWRRMTSAVEGVAIAIGDALDKALQGVLDNIAAVAGKITAFVGSNQAAILGVLQFAAALGGVGAALMALGSALAITAVALKGFLVLLSPVGLLGAGTVGVLYLTGAFDGLGKAIEKLPEPIKAFGSTASEIFGLLGDVVLAAFDVVTSIIRDKAAVAFNFWVHGFNRPIANAMLDITEYVISAFENATEGIRQPIGSVLNLVKNMTVSIAQAVQTMVDKILGALSGLLRFNLKIADAIGIVPKSVTDGIRAGLKSFDELRVSAKKLGDDVGNSLKATDLSTAADQMFKPFYFGLDKLRETVNTDLKTDSADLAKAGLSNAVAVLGNRLKQMAGLDKPAEAPKKLAEDTKESVKQVLPSISALLSGAVVQGAAGFGENVKANLAVQFKKLAAGFEQETAQKEMRMEAPRVSTVGSFSAREASSAGMGLSGSMNSLTGAVKKLDNTIQKSAARVPAYGA